MNVKIPAFAIRVEAIIYLLFHNLDDCTFKGTEDFRFLKVQKISDF